MTPELLLIITVSGGVIGGVFMGLFAIYLTAQSFVRRVVWEDHATRRGKLSTVGRYIFQNANWGELPRIVGYGILLGSTVALVVTLVLTGAYHTLS